MKCNLQGKLESRLLKLMNLTVPGLCVMPLSPCDVSGGILAQCNCLSCTDLKTGRGPSLIKAEHNSCSRTLYFVLSYVQIMSLAKSLSFLKFAYCVLVHMKFIWQVSCYICESVIAKIFLKFMFIRLMYLLLLNMIQQNIHVLRALLNKKGCT